MWWCDRKSPRRIARLSLLAFVPLALAGCEATIHPLYMSHGGNLQAELQSIAVDPIPDRFGHYLGDKLQTALNGTGAQVAPRYHLVVVPSLNVTSPLISTVTSTAQAATVLATANFRLIPVGGGAPVLTGSVKSTATYDRTEQRYANLRAARDAEIRDAETLADLITQQVAAKLAVN